MLSHEGLENLLDTIGRNMVFSGGYESFNEFKEELNHIRSKGYSRNYQLDSENLLAVAAPIRNESGELVGILQVYGPAYRMTGELLEDYSRMLKDVAVDVSSRMGFVRCSDPRE
jgi:DNA-binding IclR family transcriptional regulator